MNNRTVLPPHDKCIPSNRIALYWKCIEQYWTVLEISREKINTTQVTRLAGWTSHLSVCLQAEPTCIELKKYWREYRTSHTTGEWLLFVVMFKSWTHNIIEWSNLAIYTHLQASSHCSQTYSLFHWNWHSNTMHHTLCYLLSVNNKCAQRFREKERFNCAQELIQNTRNEKKRAK